MTKWVHVAILTILVIVPSLISGQSISETAFVGDHVLELTAWDSSDGLPGSYISNFIQSSKGVLFLHLPKFGTYTFDGKKTRTCPRVSGQADHLGGAGKTTYFAEDVNGNVWKFLQKNGKSPIEDIVIYNGYGTTIESFTSYTGIPKDSINLFEEAFGVFVTGNDLYFANLERPELWKYDGEFRLLVDLASSGTNGRVLSTHIEDRYLLFNADKKELSLIDKEGRTHARLTPTYGQRIDWNSDPIASNSNTFFAGIAGDFERLLINDGALSLEEVPSPSPLVISKTLKASASLKRTENQGADYSLRQTKQLKNQLYFNGELVMDDFDNLLKEKFKLELSDLGRKLDDNSFWLASTTHFIHLRFTKRAFEIIELPSLAPSVRSISPVGENQLLVSTYSGNYVLNHTLDDIHATSAAINGYQYIRSATKIDDAFWHGTEYGRLGVVNWGRKQHSVQTSNCFNIGGVISAIAPQKNGKLLLGTSVGLKEFDPTIGQATATALDNQEVHTIYKSLDQATWVGHQDGLYNYSTQQAYLPGFQVRHIYEDSGVFWIATNKGLIEWEIGSSNHQSYSKEHGLPNTIIHCVYPDKNNNLWMSTDYGLVKFSKAPPHAVQVFLEKDGLPGNEFNQFAHYQNEKGELYLGGTKGLIKFNADSIRWEENSGHYPIVLEEVLVYDNKNRLRFKKQPAELSSLEKLQLPTSSHRVELKFTSPYYGAAELVKEWRTSRLYPEWTKVTKNEINFHFLDYGSDELEIRTYPFGNTSKIETFKIKLDKPIPFHKTTFSLFLLVVFLVAGTYFLAKLRARREKEKLKKQVEQKTLSIEQQKAEIEAQKEELEKVGSYREKFFKNITHDFKTPLSIILGSSEQIAKQKKVSSNTLTQVERISNNALQLNSLTDQIFALTKADNKQLQLNESTIEWGRFCRNTVESFTSLAEEKTIDYTITQLPNQLTYLRLDLQKMEQVLRNLLDNALKFTEPSGSVSFSTTVQEDTIVFQVEDSGPGIPANEMEHIFKRYYQGVNTESLHFTGLGIGLSLCKDYLELMNGTIEATTTALGGICFRVSFPKKTSEESLVEELALTNSSKVSLKEKAPSIIFNHGKPALLIVEDNPDLLNYYKESLVTDYSLLLAKNGKDALALLNKSHLKVDLIISDVMMPEMNGYEFVEIVKNSQQHALIPVILITALTGPTHELNALRIGIDAYLTKPFSINELNARIKNLLRYQQLRSAHQPTTVSSLGEQAPKIEQEPLRQIAPTEKNWLAQLEKVITKRIANPDLRIKLIASDLKMSERTLRTKIKESTGLTPSEYLLKMRLAEALKLLQENRYDSIAETCYQVGLKNPSHFAKLFKQEYGRLPSSYR